MKYRCSMLIVIDTIAKDSLKKAYPFFTITPNWKDKPVSFNFTPIDSTEKVNRYCNEVYYDAESDLEDDKCHPIGFGSGYPKQFNVEVTYYKKRNPIFPVWDAQKIIKEKAACLAYRQGEPLQVEYKQEEFEE